MPVHSFSCVIVAFLLLFYNIINEVIYAMFFNILFLSILLLKRRGLIRSLSYMCVLSV